jgi:copper ion binding protein
MKDRVIEEKNAVLRHSFIELAEHWVLALSGLLLIFSGFGELPMYKRYMVTQIPGLGWAGDFFIQLKVHYLAGIVFVSVMAFHAVYHGWLGHQGLLPKKGDVKASLITILSMFGIGEEPKSHKYLPEQRLAYAYLGGIGLILLATGVIKVIKNLPGVFLPPGLITSMTLTHTFATIFFLMGVMAHLAALIFKVNRPLVRSIFTREVDLDYVRDRHTVWYDELVRNKVKENAEVKAKVEVKDKAKGIRKATAEAEGKVQKNPINPSNPTNPINPINQAKVEVKAEKEKQTEESKITDSALQTESINPVRKSSTLTGRTAGPSNGVKEKDMMANVLKVKGMSCQHCVMSITKALNQLDGVKNVNVDLQKGEVRFENTKGVASSQIEKAITDAGYEVISA